MCDCSETEKARARAAKSPVSLVGPATRPLVPLAVPVPMGNDSSAEDQTTQVPQIPQTKTPVIIPPFNFCSLDFREGCYQLNIRPPGLISFEGTLRVDRSAPDGGSDNLIASGDLYTRLPVIGPTSGITISSANETHDATTSSSSSSMTVAGTLSAAEVLAPPLQILKPTIPIFPRARYHSYLKVTQVSAPILVPSPGQCVLTITAEQFNYTQPPAGQFKGTFPNSPSRTVTMKLTKVAAPFPFSLTGGPYYEGRLFEGAVDKGSVTLAWVSPFFRKATLEIDTLVGAVRPAPVPDGAGGTEFFDTIYAKHGWQLSVVQDQLNIPVPGGVTATNCWSSADLHALMTARRNPSTNLDAEWRVHMIVVPAKLGCGRGVMYDQIGVPREGCATFCDDGYPTSDSSNFGASANKKQRDVPRAYLRSATHELTHTLNQIHQEQETVADNSIMTTTPSVADVLGGPATGQAGIFPDQIKLAVNTNVRHHLNHMPDPVIRPGGWPFASWFPTGAPQAADRHDFAPSELLLTVMAGTERLALGQPLDLSWTLTNTGSTAFRAPNDVSIEALFASITVTDAEGRERPVRPYTILCENARLIELEPGNSISASTKVFWSSAGFAFERPGRYHIDVAVSWSAQGVLVGVQDGVDVFVDYPASDADNYAAGLVLHREVGTWVALGGEAYHLEEGARRLQELSAMGTPADTARARVAGRAADSGGGAAPRVLDGFAGLLPNATTMARMRADNADETDSDDTGSTTASTRATKPRGRTGRKR